MLSFSVNYSVKYVFCLHKERKEMKPSVPPIEQSVLQSTEQPLFQHLDIMESTISKTMDKKPDAVAPVTVFQHGKFSLPFEVIVYWEFLFLNQNSLFRTVTTTDQRTFEKDEKDR